MLIKNKIIWITLLLFISRIADLYATNVLIPDLEHEMNPIVSLLGGKWVAMIITNFIICAVLIYFTNRFFKIKMETNLNDCQNLKQYVSKMAFDRNDKFFRIFYKTPKHFSPFTEFVSYGAIIATIICGPIFVAHNYYIVNSDTYRNFIKNIPIFGFMSIYVVYAILIYAMVYLIIAKEFNRQKSRNMNNI